MPLEYYGRVEKLVTAAYPSGHNTSDERQKAAIQRLVSGLRPSKQPSQLKATVNQSILLLRSKQ